MSGEGLHFPAIADWMTDERRAFIREVRLRDGFSLRATASACFDQFGGGPWSPDWNQLAGMDLCELAGVDDDSPDMNAPEWHPSHREIL